MIIFWWVCAVLMTVIFFLRITFSAAYYRKINKKSMQKIDERKYTVIQPVLSGDSRLEEDLNANIMNTNSMQFIFLVDKIDIEAQRIAKKIKEKSSISKRVTIFEIDEVPQEVNPKIFKILQGIDKVKTEYLIILDDDSVMDSSRLNELSIYEKRNDEWLATGIPYNYGLKGIWSELVAAFINGNSILTYFSMSFLKNNKTINGMFYIGKTELFCKYEVFEKIKYWLCDDLAIATYLLEKNVTILQTSIFCNVRMTVFSMKKYILLMKRWLLFASIYMKQAFSLKFFIFILLPCIIPSLLLGGSLFCSLNYITGTLILFFMKSFILYLFRYYILKKKEKFSVILYEILSDLLIILIFIYTLLTPPVIYWRNKKIRVSDGRIHYEKI